MYQGIRSDDISSLMYTSVFSVRRIFIVLANLLFTKSFMPFRLSRDFPFWKIECFILI